MIRMAILMGVLMAATTDNASTLARLRDELCDKEHWFKDPDFYRMGKDAYFKMQKEIEDLKYMIDQLEKGGDK